MAQNFNQHQALVLNADFRPLRYFPLSLLSWQDAVQAVVAEKVTVVASYPALARSPSTAIALPSVIALRRYQSGVSKVAFTRFNVFLRDRFTCQYCGRGFEARALTFDHVVPRCLGGRTAWDNVVAACGSCNTAKGGHTGLKPLRSPRVPKPAELMAARQRLPADHLHQSWLDYLYWDAELQN